MESTKSLFLMPRSPILGFLLQSVRLFWVLGRASRFSNSNCVSFDRDLLLISPNQEGLLVDVEPSQASSVFNRSGGEGESFFIGIAASDFDAVDGGEACLLSGDRGPSKRSFTSFLRILYLVGLCGVEEPVRRVGQLPGQKPQIRGWQVAPGLQESMFLGGKRRGQCSLSH